jgi:hypothetical protein
MTKGSELYRLGPSQKVQVLSKQEQKTRTPYDADQTIPLTCKAPKKRKEVFCKRLLIII